LFERREIDDGDLQPEIVVAEAALSDPHKERRLTALESGSPLRARATVVSLVPACRGLAVTRAGSAADALAGLVLRDATMDVVENHQTSTPRSRATWSRVRSLDRASNVALTTFIAFVEP